MKNYLSISIASIMALTASGIANAQLYVTAEIGGIPSVSGATLENFDEPNPSILTLSGDAGLFIGSSVNAEAPYFSGSTAAYFGESPTSGWDASQFVAVYGPGGTATLSFSTPQNYFGILWGSVDYDNLLTFYGSANNMIGTVSGPSLPGVVVEGDETVYVNITSTTAFSSVVVSGSDSFEFDDVAYAVVPEPTSSVLFSAGLCFLALALRRKFGNNTVPLHG